MPKPNDEEKAKSLNTTEEMSYLRGLNTEFQKQIIQYHRLTQELLSLEGRIELSEKMLCLTRDHLAMAIDRADSTPPEGSDKMLKGVRFVGVRLADACKVLLQEKRQLALEEILEGLNHGMFRFRTSSPLREIHAALLRQNFAKKQGKKYLWIGEPQQQVSLRLSVPRRVIGMTKSASAAVPEGT
jgi:hypothetical protein